MRNKTKLFPFKQKLNKSDDESSAISKVDNDVKLKTQIHLILFLIQMLKMMSKYKPNYFLLNKNITNQMMNLVLIQK
jgi:hypothetical protein